jgi:hypothetical protein
MKSETSHSFLTSCYTTITQLCNARTPQDSMLTSTVIPHFSPGSTAMHLALDPRTPSGRPKIMPGKEVFGGDGLGWPYIGTWLACLSCATLAPFGITTSRFAGLRNIDLSCIFPTQARAAIWSLRTAFQFVLFPIMFYRLSRFCTACFQISIPSSLASSLSVISPTIFWLHTSKAIRTWCGSARPEKEFHDLAAELSPALSFSRLPIVEDTV